MPIAFWTTESSHLKQWKMNMPYSQIRMKRNCSKESDCVKHMGMIAERLREKKKYPSQIVENLKSRALTIDREECLIAKNERKGVIKGKFKVSIRRIFCYKIYGKW